MSYNTCIMNTTPYFGHGHQTIIAQTNTIWNLSGLMKKLQATYNPFEQGISSMTTGYNEVKDKKESIINKVYFMAGKNISDLVNPFGEANQALNEIENLCDNWNDNGSLKFSTRLIQKARSILNELAAEPFVCPTACGAIQMEYEKNTGEYLEFEIYEDKVNYFLIDKDGIEVEDIFYGLEAINKMKQLVVNFYG